MKYAEKSHIKGSIIREAAPASRRVFIITGTSRGLGRSLSRQLLRDGNQLFLITRKSIAVQKENINDCRVRNIVFDLSGSDGLECLMKKIFGNINFNETASVCLINNAAVISPISFAGEMPVEGMAKSIAVNYTAPAILSNLFIKMAGSFKGPKLIFNISSGAARRPIEGWSLYCGSKSAIDIFTRCVAKEQSRFRMGVNIYTVDPGAMNTGMQSYIRKSKISSFPAVGEFKRLYRGNLLTDPDMAAMKLIKFIDRKLGRRT